MTFANLCLLRPDDGTAERRPSRVENRQSSQVLTIHPVRPLSIFAEEEAVGDA